MVLHFGPKCIQRGGGLVLKSKRETAYVLYDRVVYSESMHAKGIFPFARLGCGMKLWKVQRVAKFPSISGGFAALSAFLALEPPLPSRGQLGIETKREGLPCHPENNLHPQLCNINKKLASIYGVMYSGHKCVSMPRTYASCLWVRRVPRQRVKPVRR